MNHQNKFEYLRDASLSSSHRADRFIQQLGYTPQVKDCEKEMNKLYKKFPELYENFISLSEQRLSGDHKDSTIYEAKNANPIFCRSISSMHQAPIWSEWMKWILENLKALDSLNFTNVLDCGCDTGVTTFFLAALYPEANIVGVDNCESGIELAEIANQKHGLNNVIFINVDLIEHLKANEAGYDFINSVACLREVFRNENQRYAQWSLNTEDYINVPYFDNPVNADISNALKGCLKEQNCQLLFLERLGSPRCCYEFMNHLGNAGAEILDFSGIKFTTFDEPEYTLLALVGFSSERRKFSMLEAMGYYAKVDELMLADNQKQRDIYECLVFDSIANKQLRQGCFYDYVNGSGIACVEIWETGTLLIGHYRNVYGLAETKYWPQSYTQGAEYFMKINDLEMQAHCDFMPYDTEIKKREILRELEEKYADNFQALRT
jgi:SAM-dependent methyltransferase